MENNGQIVIMLALLLGSMMALMVCSAILPKPYDMIVGGALYFSVIIGGFGGGMLYTRERYNKYPHFELNVFPSKNEIQLFVAHQTNRIREGGANNSAIIDLAFEKYFDDINTTSKKVVVNYKGTWQRRTHGCPCDIEVNGFTVPHPNSDKLIVRFVGLSLEFQEAVPAYELLMGSSDIVPQYDVTNIDIPEGLDNKTTAIALAKETPKSLADKLVQAYTVLQDKSRKLDEQIRRAVEWQSLAESQQDTIRQQKGEIRSLLANNASIKERALEWLLSIYNGQGSLAKTIKAIRAKDGDNNMIYIVIAAIAVAGIAAVWLYLNPQVTQNIFTTINNPALMIVGAIVVIVGLYLFFRYYKRDSTTRKVKGKR